VVAEKSAFKIKIENKMSEVSVEIRAVIRYLFMKGLTNAAIFDEINAVYGTECRVASLSTVKYWTGQFRSGRVSLVDEVRSGRPRIPNLVEQVSAMMEENPYISQKKLARAFSVDPATMRRILSEDLNLVRVNFRWIPHRLSPAQKEARVTKAAGLLQALSGSERDWCNTITGDETWVYLDNPRDFMWQEAGLERPTRPRHHTGSKKVMITVMWSTSGIHTISMLPVGARFNKAYFHTVLDELAAKIHARRPARGTSGIRIHVDNARPHLVGEKIEQLGMIRLEHPPYSPDLAPSDFFLFGFLKTSLQGSTFETPEELLARVSEILHGIERDVFLRVFREWISRLSRCIDGGGEYIH